MKIVCEHNGIGYYEGAHGCLYPNLTMPVEHPRYGIIGRRYKAYLKEHRPLHFNELLMTGKLTDHLNLIDELANEKLGLIVEQMKRSQGITEELKAENQMAWVGAMNNIRSAAMEIVMSEILP